ncbi:B12-binding domain-containing radical SAM protein [Abyssisolibacter fermentans]|uniref:B12-binding domain-containing radical SAM protein n=1 Tax=Abyssisolibacter fermentans TaxID=1766203 RepID=UPI00082D9D1B|nr:radical SAM protein [Abyssisolibacter fermentans]
MKDKDKNCILIVNPRMISSSQTDNFYKYLPLGMLYLASYAQKYDYEVEVLDLSIYKNWVDILRSKASSNKYQIIGISGTTPTHENIKQIASIFKKYNESCTIIAGGPHATFIGQDILSNMDVDIVIKGEGEIAFIKVLDYLIKGQGCLDQISGIVYKLNNNIFDTGKTVVIKNLDSIPFPLWNKVNMNYYTKEFFPIITSRGCPGRCIFCSAGAMSNGQYRRRSNDNIIEEIKCLYQKYKIDSFLFADNTFTVQRENVIKLCKRFRELPFEITWYCESRIDALDDELVQEMIKGGCIGLQIGIESSNQEILDTIKKRIDITNIAIRLKHLFDQGMQSVFCTFVLGLPGETEKTLKETVKLMTDLKHIGVNVYTSLSTPFPGTYLCNHAEELNILIKHKKWSRYFFNEITSFPQNLNEKTLRKYFVKAAQLTT